jgi:predicted nucleic acid-binding protein
VTAFVDTSALYAALDRSDAHHRRAAEALRRLISEDAVLVTSNYVLVETTALLQGRLGMDAVRTFHGDLAPLLQVEWIAEVRHQAGMEATLAAGRRKLSLVDCTSFQIMREAGIATAFCFDQHFPEQGFEVIPCFSEPPVWRRRDEHQIRGDLRKGRK